jgi:glycosyltransferase involved in cell wall biosynthesis
MLPVSICLTTYNRSATLPATLDAILGQTFANFELIISDDCSTDSTQQVCREYAARDSRIRYFRNSQNLKMPGNLNAAIQRAQGQYVANLHDGDRFRSDLIQKWKDALDRVPDAAFVFNAYATILPGGGLREWREPFEFRVPGKEIAAHYFRHISSCVWGTVMARKSAYDKNGLFDPSFGFISDVDMWLRLALGSTVAYVNEPLMVLTDRESDHPFAYHSWQHLFWQFAILARHLPRYARQLPLPGQKFYQDVFRKRALWGMLSLMKRGKWGRVREGFAIWRDADDPLLRFIGKTMGSRKSLPAWYNPSFWEKIRVPEVACAASARIEFGSS